MLFRIGITVSGREGAHAPQERRKQDGETGDGVGKMFPSPQARTPLVEFHHKNIDFPTIAF
jgi:hypothetical protein